MLVTQGHELAPWGFIHWSSTVCLALLSIGTNRDLRTCPVSVPLKFQSSGCHSEMRHHTYTKIVIIRCLVNSAE